MPDWVRKNYPQILRVLQILSLTFLLVSLFQHNGLSSGFTLLLTLVAGEAMLRHSKRRVTDLERTNEKIKKGIREAKFNQPRATKFEYLLKQDLLSEDDLKKAQDESRVQGKDIESILMDQYKVPKSEIGTALTQFYKC